MNNYHMFRVVGFAVLMTVIFASVGILSPLFAGSGTDPEDPSYIASVHEINFPSVSPVSTSTATFRVSLQVNDPAYETGRYSISQAVWDRYDGASTCVDPNEEIPNCTELFYPPLTTLCPFISFRPVGSQEYGNSGGGGILNDYKLLYRENGEDVLEYVPSSVRWEALVRIPCLEGSCPINEDVDERDPTQVFPRSLLGVPLSCRYFLEPAPFDMSRITSTRVYASSITDELGEPPTSIPHGDIITITATVTAPTPTCTDNCVSNIAFIPGFEASRLYENNSWLGGEDQLWEPTKPNDVPELALSAEGVSIKPNVYTRDVIDTGRLLGIVGVFDVYKNFMASLDTLKDPKNGIIADWRAFPYDWRFDPRDIVANGVRFENEVRHMETEIEELAETSKTGKVTIVAHSMGGHIAKVLVDKLKEEGKAHLIDRIIFVATPHLGTPKAIAGLLHGDGQEIPGKESYFTGLLATPADARSLGLTLPSAHNLLPSSGYFGKVFDPVVDLTRARSLQTDALGTYLIRDYDSLATFLTAEGSPARTQPNVSDVNALAVLNEQKLLRAKTLHDTLDTWTPPQGITTVNIAGWGLLTMRGIAYSEKQNNGTYLYHHDPLVTAEGDATVVYASAQGEGERYFVDLQKLFDVQKEKHEHVDILESTPVRSLIKNLITHTATTSPPEFVSLTKPELSTASSTLRLSVYSPADLHLYDSIGRHTGRLPSNDGFVHYEEGIPGTTYMELGESKHIIAPEGDYRSELKGTGEGTFDFIVRTSNGGSEETPRATYTDVPVSTETIATVAVSLDTPPAPLSLDENGDGTEDESVLPEEANAQTFPELLALFRTKADTLSTSPATKNNLLLRASSTETTYQKLLTLRETRKDRRTALATLFDTRLSSSFSAFLTYTNTLATLPPQRKRKLTSVQEATLNTLLEEIETSLAPDEETGLPPEIETVHTLIENAKKSVEALSLHESVLKQIKNKLTAIETRHARALTRLGTFDARTQLAEANLKKVLTTKLTNLSLYTNRLTALPPKNKNRLTAEDATALQSIVSTLTNLIETI